MAKDATTPPRPTTTPAPPTTAQQIEINGRSLSKWSRARYGLIAACTFAMIFVGANTGALLRQESETSKERERLQQSPQELLMALEARKRELVRERTVEQRKLDQFVKARAAKEDQDM